MSNFLGLTINSNAIQIATGFQSPFTVKNTGNAPVYLGGSSVTSSSGRTLPAQSSVIWDPSTTGGSLYAVTAAGTTTTVDVYDSSGQTFDAGAVAAEMIAQLAGNGVAQPYLQETLLNVAETTPSPTFNYQNIKLDTAKYSLLDIWYNWDSQSFTETTSANQTIKIDFSYSSDPTQVIVSKLFNVGPGYNYIQCPIFCDTVTMTLLYASSAYASGTAPVYSLQVFASNGKQHYSCISSGANFITENVNGEWNFNSNDGIDPRAWDGGMPLQVNVWNFGNIANPGVVFEIPANTGTTDVSYNLGIPNNGSGHARIGFGYATTDSGTSLDEMRFNPVVTIANVLLAASWQQSMDNLYEVPATTASNPNNRITFFDAYLPNVPTRIVLIHRAGKPAAKLVIYWPDVPTF